jgi:hypothetical protein
MNPTKTIYQHEELRRLKPRNILLTVALIAIMGWIYLLSKAAMFIGAKLFS